MQYKTSPQTKIVTIKYARFKVKTPYQLLNRKYKIRSMNMMK